MTFPTAVKSPFEANVAARVPAVVTFSVLAAEEYKPVFTSRIASAGIVTLPAAIKVRPAAMCSAWPLVTVVFVPAVGLLLM